MVLEILTSFGLLVGWLFTDYLFTQYFGDYDKGLVKLLEFLAVFFIIGLISPLFLASNEALFIFLSLLIGVLASLSVKSTFLLLFKRFKPIALMESKSFKISIIRNLRAENVSKKKIKNAFKRSGFKIENYLKYFE